MSKLRKLIKALPGRQGHQFDPILIFPGLECWLNFLKEKLKEEGQVKGEDEIYRSWFKKYVSCDDALESNILFSKLFQNLQIRSCTEAIAETVGSIMNQRVETLVMLSSIDYRVLQPLESNVARSCSVISLPHINHLLAMST